MSKTIHRGGARRVLKKTFAVLFSFALLAFNNTAAMRGLRSLPEAVFAETETELYEKLGGLPVGELTVCAVSSGDESLGGRRVALSLPFGVTLREIPAFVGGRPRLVPGGEAVGVSIYTDGVLVVGLSDFVNAEGERTSPASRAGLRPGDVILLVDGEGISSSEELSRKLSRAGNTVRLTIERGGRRSTVTAETERDPSGEARLGAWVRDSTVGVGTLSFFERGTGLMAALGHAAADADTGSLLKVRDGRLVIAGIIGVTKGRQGAPGELHGTFGSASREIGSIDANTELGIFGRLTEEAMELLSAEELETAFPDEVHTGKAELICAASGRAEIYECRILKTERQSEPAQKGLIIEVTDERLLELTGGVVQGMSGSPIIQDGRLVGAVTHVFVNDPTKGCGAYAYWMYRQITEAG